MWLVPMVKLSKEVNSPWIVVEDVDEADDSVAVVIVEEAIVGMVVDTAVVVWVTKPK